MVQENIQLFTLGTSIKYQDKKDQHRRVVNGIHSEWFWTYSKRTDIHQFHFNLFRLFERLLKDIKRPFLIATL